MTVTVQTGKTGAAASPATGRGESEPRWHEHAVARIALAALVPTAVVALWEGMAWAEHLSTSVPAPSTVAATLWHWIFGVPKSSVDIYAGTWWLQVQASGQRVIAGYLLAAAVGIPLGVVIGANRIAHSLLDPLIQALRTVPAPAWVPLSLAFFGLSQLTAVGLIALVAFFPIVVNTIGGVHQVPILYRNAARMLGASPLVVWRRVLLPAALPFVFVGLRLAAGMAWIAVVVSELVGVRSGLGYSLYQAYQFGRMDVLIATMATLGVLGLISDRAVGLLSRKLIAA